MLEANSFNAYFSSIPNDLKLVLIQVIMGKPYVVFKIKTYNLSLQFAGNKTIKP